MSYERNAQRAAPSGAAPAVATAVKTGLAGAFMRESSWGYSLAGCCHHGGLSPQRPLLSLVIGGRWKASQFGGKEGYLNTTRL
jgi:hypothetical protein